MYVLNEKLFLLPWPWPLVLIVLFMGVFAVVAYKANTLDLGGAAFAFVLGVVTLWILRLEGFLLLLMFFVSCNIVGKISKRIRGKLETDNVEKKGSRRDFMQVLANGLMAVLAALLWAFSLSDSALIMFGAAVAEAMSDTFAGEIGRLSKNDPISIRTLKRIKKGLSGGVTFLGTMAALLSSAFIALCWALWFQRPFSQASLVCLLGFAGAVLDSYLGATVQAQFLDPDTNSPTEHDTKNGVPLKLIRGIRFMDNDMVNLMSNAFSATFALGMGALLF